MPPHDRPTPRDDAATRRRRLLDAADEVFSEQGVNARSNW
jgi:AcrR family transcriptional regulator